MFERNLGVIVDCNTLNVIESNVKKVKTIVKKLLNLGFRERVVKMMMYQNLTIFVLKCSDMPKHLKMK